MLHSDLIFWVWSAGVPPAGVGRKVFRDSGFTLIELVLVGALLAVFVGLTMPRFRGGFQRFTDERASSEMEELSHYARTIAIMRGVPYRLAFSNDDGSYRLLRSDKGNFVPVDGNAGRRRRLPEGAKPQGPSLDVTFLPNGTAVGGPLKFWRDKEALWQFQVDPVLGEATIVENVDETTG
ncbi:MAG: GspH/FimT family pseudopilin [Elusimicrobia bacterium]|nr:GspH/FimT family pseudopilin [Elusimicrobiota bacterium]